MTQPDYKELPAHLFQIPPNAEDSPSARATSAFLSLILGVDELAQFVGRRMGMGESTLECYAGVAFTLKGTKGDPDRIIRPAGIIELHKGSVTWKAMVEVTVGDLDLDGGQIEDLHRAAAQEGFHALITLGNQPPTDLGLPPVTLNRRRLRKVPAFHFSWESLFQEAQFLTCVVDGHCEKWLLSEWLAFMDNPESPITTRYGLGPFWENVEVMAQGRALKAKDQAVLSVAQAWRNFLQACARQASARLGVEVRVAAAESERTNGELHTTRIANRLANHRKLSGRIQANMASEPMELTFCPATSEASIATDFCVPSTATPPQALRQLAEKLKKARVGGGDRLQLYWDHKSLKSYLPISQFLENPQELMGIPGEPSIPATAQIVRAVFERRWQTAAEGEGRSAQFLDQISRALDEFCADVIHRIAPPK